MSRTFKLRQFRGTATALTDKMKIGTKLQLSNFVLVITVLIVTAISFQFLSSRYLVNEASRQMKADEESIVRSLNKVQRLSDQSVAERVASRQELRLTGRVLDSKIVVFDNTNRIVYTNVSTGDIRTLKQLDQQNNSNYLVVRRPIFAEDGEKTGRILLAAKIDDVRKLNRLLQGAQLVSIVIGAIFALGMGYLLGRSISKPIRSLAAGMRRFSPKSIGLSITKAIVESHGSVIEASQGKNGGAVIRVTLPLRKSV